MQVKAGDKVRVPTGHDCELAAAVSRRPTWAAVSDRGEAIKTCDRVSAA
jgi:hypothetical protein